MNPASASKNPNIQDYSKLPKFQIQKWRKPESRQQTSWPADQLSGMVEFLL